MGTRLHSIRPRSINFISCLEIFLRCSDRFIAVSDKEELCVLCIVDLAICCVDTLCDKSVFAEPTGMKGLFNVC